MSTLELSLKPEHLSTLTDLLVLGLSQVWARSLTIKLKMVTE